MGTSDRSHLHSILGGVNKSLKYMKTHLNMAYYNVEISSMQPEYAR